MENQDIAYFQQKYGNKWLTKWKQSKHTSKYTKNGVKRRMHWNDFDEYKHEVKQLTEHNASNIPDIHRRGFNSYHIDHKISIKYGYDNGLLPEHIAHHSNLQMLHWKDNIRKSAKCKIDGDNEWIMSI